MKPSDSEAPVLDLSGMWNTPSLPLLLDPFCPAVVPPFMVVSIGPIEQFDHLTECKQMIDVELNS